MLTVYKPNRPLRSLGSSQLEIPRVHTKQGESAFSYYAARSWNQLPEEIKCAKTLATFKSRLKTHLFSCAFVEWALCYVRTDCIILCIILFYLTVLNFILNQFLYHFKIPCLLFLTPCFYCCEWLFHFLCKALWITNVYEMCYTNKLALPCLIWSCSCPHLVWLLVDSPHLSVPHDPVFISPGLFSLCLSGLLVWYVCCSSSCCDYSQCFLD